MLPSTISYVVSTGCISHTTSSRRLKTTQGEHEPSKCLALCLLSQVVPARREACPAARVNLEERDMENYG